MTWFLCPKKTLFFFNCTFKNEVLNTVGVNEAKVRK